MVTAGRCGHRPLQINFKIRKNFVRRFVQFENSQRILFFIKPNVSFVGDDAHIVPHGVYGLRITAVCNEILGFVNGTNGFCVTVGFYNGLWLPRGDVGIAPYE